MSIQEKVDAVGTPKVNPSSHRSDSGHDTVDLAAAAVDGVRSRHLSSDRHSSRRPSENGGGAHKASGRPILHHVAPDGVAVFDLAEMRSPGGSLARAQSAQQAFDKSSAPAAHSSPTEKDSPRKSGQMKRQKTPVTQQSANGTPPLLVVPERPVPRAASGSGENPSPLKVSSHVVKEAVQGRVSSDPLPVPRGSVQIDRRSQSTPVEKVDRPSAEELVKIIKLDIDREGRGALVRYVREGRMDLLTVFFGEINKSRQDGTPIVKEFRNFQGLVDPALRGQMLKKCFKGDLAESDRPKLLEFLCSTKGMEKEQIEELRKTGCQIWFGPQMLWSYVTEIVANGWVDDLKLIIQKIPVSGDLMGDALVQATKNQGTPNRSEIIALLKTKRTLIPDAYLAEVARLNEKAARRQADEKNKGSQVCVIC